MSPQPLSGEKGNTERYEGGAAVVIICAYEEGWSSLGTSPWQLLWSLCLWGEVAQRRGCTPQRLVVKWVPKEYNSIHYLHIRHTNYFQERTKMIRWLVNATINNGSNNQLFETFKKQAAATQMWPLAAFFCFSSLFRHVRNTDCFQERKVIMKLLFWKVVNQLSFIICKFQVLKLDSLLFFTKPTQ